LLDRGVPLRADVLKVPHHGSRKQSLAFLDAVGADVALTPVGAGNPYGHPSADTLSHLEKGGARVYRSDRDGDVALVVRGGSVTTVARGSAGVLASAHHPGPGTTAAAASLRLPVRLPEGADVWCDSPVIAGPVRA
jgi:competence protein ComEC